MATAALYLSEKGKYLIYLCEDHRCIISRDYVSMNLRGGYTGVLWVLKNPPSGKIHYKLSRGGFREGGLWGLSPTFIISVHARFSMSDSFVDLPQEVVN